MKRIMVGWIATMVCCGSMGFADSLLSRIGTRRVDAEGAAVTSGILTGVYFSNRKSGQEFTGDLMKVYRQAQKEGVAFDVVFVSTDTNRKEMLSYMQETRMPWLATPYQSEETSRAKNFKTSQLKERGPLCLVILNSDGEVLSKNGCSDLEELGFGALEKWASDPVIPVTASWETPEPVREPLGPPPAPEKKEMTILELGDRLAELDGKVIEVIANRSFGFREVGEGFGRAFCSYQVGNPPHANQPVLIPEEGKAFFEAWSAPEAGHVQKIIYMRVHSENPIKIKGNHQSFRLEAVGLRYRKSKGAYSW